MQRTLQVRITKKAMQDETKHKPITGTTPFSGEQGNVNRLSELVTKTDTHLVPLFDEDAKLLD
jgi:hypothetical protein